MLFDKFRYSNRQMAFHWRHDDVVKMKHFPRYWPFVRGIHQSPVNSPHKGQWRGALMFSFICVWINVWVNNREAGDLRRYRVHDDVFVMGIQVIPISPNGFCWMHTGLSCLHSINSRYFWIFIFITTNSFSKGITFLESGSRYKGQWDHIDLYPSSI